jgi:hypothetical protein
LPYRYCEDCTKGKFLDDDGVYVKKHNEEKDCRECEGDTYAPVWGSAECRLCPTGKYILDDDIVRNSASDCEYVRARARGGDASEASTGRRRQQSEHEEATRAKRRRE